MLYSTSLLVVKKKMRLFWIFLWTNLTKLYITFTESLCNDRHGSARWASHVRRITIFDSSLHHFRFDALQSKLTAKIHFLACSIATKLPADLPYLETRSAVRTSRAN